MERTNLPVELPTKVTVVNQTGTFVKDFQGPYQEFSGTTVTIDSADLQAVIKVSSSVPVSLLKLRWSKQFDPHTLFLGDELERGYGTMGFHKMMPNRFMLWYFIATHDEMTEAYGVMTQANAFCFWQVDPAGVTLILDLRNGGNGVELGARELVAATVVAQVSHGGSSFEATQAFCRRMCPNPVLPDHPVYGSNNWYYAYGISSNSEILADTDYLMSLTSDNTNPPYMVIDDGWQVDHDPETYNGGPWNRGNTKFPDMAALAGQIKDKVARPGIWFRPLLDHSTDLPIEWRNPINGTLDPSHPAVLQRVHDDIVRISQWGFQLIKHDFSTFDAFGKWDFQMRPFVTQDSWNFYDHTLTSAEIIKQLYQTIWEAAQPFGTFIMGCNTIGHLGAGLMQLDRIGDDTSGKEWERARQMGINSLAFRLPQDGTFFRIDADCVGITDQIDWSFNRQWADLLAESGTALFVSDTPHLLQGSAVNELKAAFALGSIQDHHFVPQDWEWDDYPTKWTDGNTTH